MKNVSRPVVVFALLCCFGWAGCKKQKAGSGSASASASATGSASASAAGSAGSATGSASASAAGSASGGGSSAGSGSASADDDGAGGSSAAAKPVAPDALLSRLLKAIKLKAEQKKKLEALAASFKGKPASAANQQAIGAALAKILDENQLAAYQLIADEMGKSAK